MYVIAQSVPFKPNYSKLGRDLECHRTSVSDLPMSVIYARHFS